MSPLSIVPQLALVLSGEAMFVAFQAGAAIELGRSLQAAGHGDQPFDLTVGSSSGSLVATAIAVGAPFDHECTLQCLIDYAQDTRPKLPRGRSLFERYAPNPYQRALARLLEHDMFDLEKALSSSTQLVLTASQYNGDQSRDLGAATLAFWQTGAKIFLSGPREDLSSHLEQQTRALLSAASNVFQPRYLSNKPWPGSSHTKPDADWTVLESKEELYQSVKASTRVPLLHGIPIASRTGWLLDGVFANNAPVELALESGARNVIVINSSRGGNVFDRPVQSMISRELRKRLSLMESGIARLESLPGRRRMRRTLSEIARLYELIPEPKPLDLEALHRRYPGQRIHVIHPTNPPPINRFTEKRPDRLTTLYQQGREAMQQKFAKIVPAA